MCGEELLSVSCQRTYANNLRQTDHLQARLGWQFLVTANLLNQRVTSRFTRSITGHGGEQNALGLEASSLVRPRISPSGVRKFPSQVRCVEETPGLLSTGLQPRFMSRRNLRVGCRWLQQRLKFLPLLIRLTERRDR